MGAQQERGRPGALELAVLAAALALAAGLRLWQLGAASLWADEIIMWSTARRPLVDGLLQLQDYSAPLYQMLLRVVAPGERPPEWLLRLPAALFGVLCVPAGWWLGRAFFGPAVGATLAVLLAANPALVAYARMARPNSLFVLLSTVSVTFFWLLRTRGRARHAAGWAASTLALLAAHYLGFLCLAAQAAWLAAEAAVLRSRFRLGRPTAAAAACVAAGAAPLALLAWRYVAAGAPATVGWIVPRGFGGLLGETGQLVGWSLPQPVARGTAAGAAFLVLALAALWRASRPCEPEEAESAWRRHGAAALCASWIAFGLLAFPLIELLYRPLLATRYALQATVPLLAGALAFAGSLHRLALLAPAAAALALCIPSLPRALEPAPGLRELTAWLGRSAPRAAPILVMDWAYAPGFVNPELVGLRYYGFDRPEVRLLELAYPDDIHIRNPEVLPERGRAFIVGFVVPAQHVRRELVSKGWKVEVRPFGLEGVLVARAPLRARP